MSKAKANEGPRCCDQVYTHIGRWGQFTPCTNRGVVERDGKLYCRMHDPEARAARRDARDAKYRAKSDARAERYERQYVLERFAAGIPTDRLKALLDAGRTLAVILEAHP